jgi:hypothetical protein
MLQAGLDLSRGQFRPGAFIGGISGRQDAAKRPRAEEAFAAGSAPVSRKSEPALEAEEGATVDALAGEVFEVKIAAPGAVSIAGEGEGYTVGIETKVAAMAPPGLQAQKRKPEIHETFAM